MSETKQLPAIIDAIGRAWFLCARHDEGQDITGRKFYGERAATTDDIAAVLAALPIETARNVVMSAEALKGDWHSGEMMRRGIAIAKLESELSACTVELNDERAKVGLMMQPMPGEKFPSESSPVWRMLQQWTANRDVEKRSERERVSRLESELSAEREGRRVEQVALADARAWFRNYCELVRFHPDDFTAEEARQRAFDDLTRLANASPPSPPPAEVCGTCGGSGAMFPRMNSGIGSPRYRVTCNICRGSGVSPGAKGEA